MPYTKANTAYRAVNGRKSKLNNAKADIKKQFSQMDLENNTAREEIEEIIGDITAKIDELTTQLSGYSFE